MSHLPKPSSVPLLCYITDRRSLGSAEPAEAHRILLKKIAEAAAAGVDWIQIREKDLSGKECSSLARAAVRLAVNSAPQEAPRAANSTGDKTSGVKNSVSGGARCFTASDATKAERARIGTRILINDRLDVALSARAGGVHLGEQSLPPQDARHLVKSLHREKDFLIGVSCHSLEAAKAAARGGGDYLFFGPVFASPSKAAYGVPQGLERLTEVCRDVALPVLAIGGITLENAASCLSAGASGIAAIRLFQDARDMAAVVCTLRAL